MNRQTIKVKSGGVEVPTELFSPSSSARCPLVVMAYGTGGMMAPFGSMYTEFADGLAQAGFHCLVPDYLAKTQTLHDLEMLRLLPTCRTLWVSALCDATAFVTALGQVDASRVASCGFSLGGNLMIHAAQTIRARAFVDFFAPIASNIDTGSVVTPSMVSGFSPTLIHHGDQDAIVPFGDSRLFEGWLAAGGIDNKLITYHGQGHPSVHDISSWSAQSQHDSLSATVQFLRARL
jgi:dienelactone hydrolase